MRLGMLDARPRSRELVWVLLAQRCARALAELKLQANQLSLEDAARFASANTPRGWLRLGNSTVWFEQHLYLQQPAYGTSYVMGKLEFDKLLAARATQLGPSFTLQRFMDDFDSAGLIPVPLIRWELTGDPSAIPGGRREINAPWRPAARPGLNRFRGTACIFCRNRTGKAHFGRRYRPCPRACRARRFAARESMRGPAGPSQPGT